MGDELARRLAELTERHRLPSEAYARLRAILSHLAADDQAPTAVRDPIRALDAHLADSLAGLDVPLLAAAGRIADLGSGAGFPGAPLAVALASSHVNLVESQARKCAFLRRLIVAAELANAEVVNARAEGWSSGVGAHDAVVARAVASPPVVLEYAAPLLKSGGILVDWRGRRDPDQERAALSAACELGLERAEVRHLAPFRGAGEHHLHVYLKVRPTPERFPRRPGIARKRPLGSPRQKAPTAGDRGRR